MCILVTVIKMLHLILASVPLRFKHFVHLFILPHKPFTIFAFVHFVHNNLREMIDAQEAVN
jgi:hypothetical protein